MNSEEQRNPRVIYTPPAPDMVEAYARMVCEGLGDDFSSDHAFMQGFSRFMQLVVKAKAKHLNKSPQVVDNDPE